MESAATPTKPKRSRAKKADEAPVQAVATAADKPRRARKAQPKANDGLSPEVLSHVKATIDHEAKHAGVEGASPLSHRDRMAAVDARATETRKRVLEEATANDYGPMPRTSPRWMGRRTKGLPFSRMIFVSGKPGINGMRGTIVVRHPTKKRGLKTLTATDSVLEIFMPSLPGSMAAMMLGVN